MSAESILEKYVAQTTAAEMMNVTPSRISQLCNQSQFEGAIKMGGSWIIPKTAIENYKPKKRGRKKNLDRVILTKAITESKQWKKDITLEEADVTK